MISNKQLYFQNLAHTIDTPLAIEIERAEGMYMYGPNGEEYLDLLGGISVSNLGHQNPQVVEATKAQIDKHMHLMVYGEFIQSPQVKLAKKLTEMLGHHFESVYFGSSGAEANDGALKLAKRTTGRGKIVAFKNAYHGSTQGVLSAMGDEYFKQAYRPLIPGFHFAEFNKEETLSLIDHNTAAVIVEPVQGEAGYRTPENNFLQKIRQKCNDTGTLLIFDEIQTGFGRTGHLFAFQKYGVVPDIITMAKGLGGGMPIGAFAAAKEVMDNFKNNPILGHITTFGGHPVSSAAALASAEIISEKLDSFHIKAKEELFRKLLVHPNIKKVHGAGMMLCVELSSFEEVQFAMDYCIEKRLIIDWFLFNNYSLRISPPLIINEDQIRWASSVILEALDAFNKTH
ncbi:MAG: aspartate aminotransferase family protein [Schleiferiaceae bacterium]|nr:aspartate aminotransferase family protein [Schleiferiaceae bacterium]